MKKMCDKFSCQRPYLDSVVIIVLNSGKKDQYFNFDIKYTGESGFAEVIKNFIEVHNSNLSYVEIEFS